MKNKLTKILGVILTLAMLSGLMIMAVPVSAGNQSWTPIKSVVLYEGTNANVYDIAADGQTILLYTNSESSNGDLYKSTDGGYTWSNSSLDTSGVLTWDDDSDDDTPNIGIILTQLVISQVDSNQILVTDGTAVYRSTNGGRTFRSLSVPGAAGVVKSLDVSENSRGEVVYLIAYANVTTGGVAYFVDGDWYTTWGGNLDLGGAAWGSQPAYTAAFVPGRPAIVAISTNGTSILLRTLVTNPTLTRTWNQDISAATVVSGAGTNETEAYLAFPSNYDYTSSNNNRVFVGLGGNLAGAFTVRPRSGDSYEIGDAGEVTSIAFTGTASSGTLAVAVDTDSDDPNVMISTNANTRDPEFDDMEDFKSPNGDNVKLKFSSDGELLYAGSDSGFFVAEDDFVGFDGISFISVSALANIVLGSGSLTGVGTPNQYQKVQDNMGTAAATDDVYYLFHSTDSGSTWKLIYTGAPGVNYNLALSPAFAEDNTMYAFASGNSEYAKSTNGGKTWSTEDIVDYIAASAFAPIDGNNYWFGSADGIQRSDSSTVVSLDGNTPFIMIMIPGFYVVPTNSGDIYVSTDNGETFNRLGEEDTFGGGPPMFAFDVPSKTVYAKATSGSIVRWVVGTSTAWQTALNIGNMPAGIDTHAKIDGISISGSVWYIKSTDASEGRGRIWRAADPLNTSNNDAGYGFEPISGTTFGADAAGEGGATIGMGPFMSIVTDPDTGIPTYYVVVQNSTTPTPVRNYTINDYNSTWLSFTDVLLAGPTTSTPAEGATVGTSVNIETQNTTAVNFAWSAVNYTGATYEYQVSYDPEFTNLVNIANNTTRGTSLTAVPLQSGLKYYFRVRVSDPMFSKWSTPVSFTTMITSDVNQGINAPGRISPENGATITNTTPVITWGSVTGATYDFKLASNSDFTTIVDERDGLTGTVFSPSSPLQAGTYFWQVRAVVGENVGNWVQSAFVVSTAAGPGGNGGQTVVPPPITVIPPDITIEPPIVTVVPSPAPATPAYIWVIIAVGAVLVIAVIVLIARTRRV